jgi:methionyl-tRNA synthetase
MKENPLNIVIGTISSLEKVEGTDKLFLLKINTGENEYRIATSLASYYQKNELVGQQIPIKIDVEPKKIRGVLSDARFIAVMDENKEPVLLVPQHKVSNGSIVM